ncbi:flagellar biosynthesis regulator FlaF [Henriciella sp. AS95]|uniref:flagellar biosynthesis regulator FlaF n=1 Tax=Henriciella sp. AS95 TaxID=3135782 RepID=UPI00316CAC3A
MHNLARKAYGDVTSRTATDKQIEYALFSEITNALKDVAAQDMPPPAIWAEAIDRNLQLWLALSIDLLNPSNQFDPQLRIGLINLGETVRRISHRVLAGEAELDELIDINEAIMAGLSGDPGSGLAGVAA